MHFAYRYVKYGPAFTSALGMRPPGAVSPGSDEQLFANELAVDVGSCCHGWDGCDLPVFDHHFSRAGQFPSAAATVLANATALQSVVNERMRQRVPREMALHAVLYAAQVRDRTLAPTGAVAVLDAARDAMCAPEYRNPLTDGLFQAYGSFARELELLKGEDARFRRDLARARKSLVLPRREAFEDWFPETSRTPFFSSHGVVDPAHTRSASTDRGLAHAVWIRDPESILFKEWARAEGFLFTAIVYSRSREYYFALDPEKCGGLHLYDKPRAESREPRAYG